MIKLNIERIKHDMISLSLFHCLMAKQVLQHVLSQEQTRKARKRASVKTDNIPL